MDTKYRAIRRDHVARNVDLLEGSIVGSLTSLALPIMATSLIQMAYNMTDMIWIGRLSADAVAAVGAAGMYLWLANGLAMIPRLGGQVKGAGPGARRWLRPGGLPSGRAAGHPVYRHVHPPQRASDRLF